MLLDVWQWLRIMDYGYLAGASLGLELGLENERFWLMVVWIFVGLVLVVIGRLDERPGQRIWA